MWKQNGRGQGKCENQRLLFNPNQRRLTKISSGDSEKLLQSKFILKLEVTGVADGLDLAVRKQGSISGQGKCTAKREELEIHSRESFSYRWVKWPGERVWRVRVPGLSPKMLQHLEAKQRRGFQERRQRSSPWGRRKSRRACQKARSFCINYC